MKTLITKVLNLKRKNIVIILGMHRSGTSCLAGSLEQCGLYLGEVFKENPHNKKGNRENARIMDLNNRLLAENDGTWDNPPLEIKWNSSLKMERDEILKDFEISGHRMWGFKDPRTLITLPFWLDGIDRYQFVGAFRNPQGVIDSLNLRNNMPQGKALTLWQKYNEILLTLYYEKSFPLISFDVSKEEYILKIKEVAKKLNLQNQNNEIKKYFFEESLRNFKSNTFNDQRNLDSIMLYNKLKQLYENQV